MYCRGDSFVKNVVIYWVFASHLVQLCSHVSMRMSLYDQRRSGRYTWTQTFGPFSFLPNIPQYFPSSLPTLFHYPRFFHPFFLTPCPALPTHCVLMWMIIWRLPLKEQETHCDRFWCESQLWPTSFTEPIQGDTLWGPRVDPWGTLSLSLHDIVFVFDIPWASGEMKEAQRSLPDHTWTQCTNKILSLPLLLPGQPTDKLL